MNKAVKTMLSFCLASVLTAGLATSSYALDHSVSYRDKTSDFSAAYTIKNLTEKLYGGVKVSLSPAPIKLCFAGDLNTTVDLSGMDRYAVDLLEKQKDGSYASAKAGVDLKDYINWDTVGQKNDLALLDRYLASENFKKAYDKTFKKSYYSIDDAKQAIKAAGLHTPTLDKFGLDLPFSGYDEGSLLKFLKPGTYLISASKGKATAEQPLEQYAVVLVIEAIKQTPVLAQPTQAKVLVDGVEVRFDAYIIKNSNHFKLRDIAQALSGSEKQFDVSWDGATNSINLISGQAYTPVGGELASGSGKPSDALPCTSVVRKDGIPTPLNAYTIDNNNFFKLRDLEMLFGFRVTWSAEQNTIAIDTKTM